MSDEENHFENTISGVLLGGLIGGGFGLGACIFIFDQPPFFVGDTILFGAIICGTLGFFLGSGFVQWLKENWWCFW